MKLHHVPYKFGTQGVVDVMAGHVTTAMTTMATTIAQVRGGKLRALAVGASERLRVMPGVPTSAEAGVPPGVIASNWWGLAAPRTTDRDIVGRLAREVRSVLSDPDIQKRYTEQGWISGGNSPAEVEERLRNETSAWKLIVERSGVKAD